MIGWKRVLITRSSARIFFLFISVEPYASDSPIGRYI